MIKPKVKVAFFIPGLGTVNRGVEANVTRMARELSDDFEITIFSTSEYQLPGIEVKTCWSISSENKIIKIIWRHSPWLNRLIGNYFNNWPFEIECLTFSLAMLPKLLANRYDVLFPVSIWGMMIARFVRAVRGAKFIFIDHGGAESFIAKQKPDIFIAQTPEMFDWMKKNQPRIYSVLCPLGVDLGFFSFKAKRAEIKLQKPIYLCVGALTSYKRIDLTIKAVSGLPEGSLVVLGDGELRAEIEQLGDSMLGKKRFLRLSVSHKETPSFYAASDVFTLVSKGDTFPVVYIEAMASGLPIVAPEDKKRRYIVGPAGIYCNPENISQYTNALLVVTKKKWGDVPRKQAEKFSLQKSHLAYKKLIEQITGKSNRHLFPN